MASLLSRLSRREPQPLPFPHDASGAVRRIGVEVEFSGLTEAETANTIAAFLGGAPVRKGHNYFLVEGSEIGDLEVYLDTAFRQANPSGLRAISLDLSRDVVPVEIVTQPLDLAGIGRLDEVVRRLRDAGAEGSHAGIFLGYGVHFNVAVPSLDTPGLLPIMRAYALLEDWLRVAGMMDGTRRLMPFADPYPGGYVRRLFACPLDAGVERLIGIYLEETPTRNRGLDMLPVFRQIDEAAVIAAVSGAESVSARPTFHYRLPDSRVDEPDWSIAYEWNRWVLIERIANDAGLTSRMIDAWLKHHSVPRLGLQGWSDRVEELLIAEPQLWEDLR